MPHKRWTSHQSFVLLLATVLLVGLFVGTPSLAQNIAQDKDPKVPPATVEPAAPSKPAPTPSDEDTPPTDEVVLPEPVEEPVAVHASNTPPPDMGDLGDQIREAMAELEATFPDGEGDAFRALLAEHPDAGGEAFFGHLTFMRRNFDRAAWFFGADALAHPGNAAAFANFGAALEETYLNDPLSRPADWLAIAVASARRANEMSPGDAVLQNNLGRGILSLWRNAEEGRNDADAASLEEALEALRSANQSDGDNIVILSNLASALDANGDSEEAAAALTRSHELMASHPSVIRARAGVSPATSQAYEATPRNYCNVDFRCGEICPPSIIGTINRVTCEMENSSAQMACGAGQPYPLSFNCGTEIPEFGVMLPGLNAGFSISSPWGNITVTTDGQGRVNWRIEAGPNFGAVNPYIRVDGTYDPNGGWSTTGFRSGVKYNLVNNSAVGGAAGRWGHQPAYVQAEQTHGGNMELSAGAYGNATILH